MIAGRWKGPHATSGDDLDRARGAIWGPLIGLVMWAVGVLALILALAGCATFANTPQQDYVYDMARPCEGHGVEISGVSPDGKSWRGSWRGGAYTWPEFQQCVREQVKAHPYQQWRQENAR